MNNKSLLILSTLLISSSVFAQTAEFILLEREAVYLQTSVNDVSISPWEDTPFYFFAEIELSEGSLSNAQVSSGSKTLQLNKADFDDNTWEAEESFDTAAEMNASILAGSYTFSGTGSSIGPFTIPINLTTPNFPSVKKITNYNDLKNVDPSKTLTVNFEEFTDYNVNSVLSADVSYWNGTESVYVWESSDAGRSDGIPGLQQNATSLTIPADVLQGAPDNNYNLWIYFSSFDSIDTESSPFGSGLIGTLTTYTLVAEINLQQSQGPTTWAGYDYATPDGWVNTGPFIGWINVTAAPFVWSSSLSKYIYLPESNVGAGGGGWAYVPN